MKPLLRPTESGVARGFMFWCPGCKLDHVFYTAHSSPTMAWAFDGNLEAPTFSPSLLNTWTEGPENTPRRCHLHLRAGQIEYCGDCSHELAGQSVPLVPTPEDAE